MLLSFLQFGAVPWKAVSGSLAAYGLMVLPLGTHYIEWAALLLFAFALAGWLDLIPGRYLNMIEARIDFVLSKCL